MAGSLPIALGELGMEVKIFMPKYRGVTFKSKKISKNVTVEAVEHEAFFNRAGLYGNGGGDYPDNLERFSFYCKETLFKAKKMGFKPDIVHLNDWQTALIAPYIKHLFHGDSFYRGVKTVYTIHNLAYQGHFPHKLYGCLGLPEELFSVSGFEFYGRINLLKAGLLFSDAVNTVSLSYAKEIETPEYGQGLDGVIKNLKHPVRGILNGINVKEWDPLKDKLIKKNFSPENLEGKNACKARLRATP